jgi:dTDP-4-amino-4,6-dideoxygalactose transaminase
VTPEIPLFKVRMSAEAPKAVARVLTSGHIAQGPEVDQFELELEYALKVGDGGDVVTVNSGTSAIHLALQLAGVRPGDGVLVTPMTCAATIAPIVHLGAEPVWVDIDPITGLVDPESIADARDRDGLNYNMLKAAVCVDWAGVPCDINALRRVLPGRMPIIEDAAHAMLAHRYKEGVVQGQLGSYCARDNLYVCYSLQAIKHLTSGDGGIVVCPTPGTTVRARKLRWFGLDRTSSKDFRAAQDIEEPGYKFHMNDVAAAIGRANLPGLRDAVLAHNENARLLRGALIDLAPRITTAPHHYGASYWVYTVITEGPEQRASLERHLKERGIGCSQVHRRNDHQPAFARVATPAKLPGVDAFSSRQLAIPCGWWLALEDLDRIIDAVRKWAAS